MASFALNCLVRSVKNANRTALNTPCGTPKKLLRLYDSEIRRLFQICIFLSIELFFLFRTTFFTVHLFAQVILECGNFCIRFIHLFPFYPIIDTLRNSECCQCCPIIFVGGLQPVCPSGSAVLRFRAHRLLHTTTYGQAAPASQIRAMPGVCQ